MWLVGWLSCLFWYTTYTQNCCQIFLLLQNLIFQVAQQFSNKQKSPKISEKPNSDPLEKGHRRS